MSDHLSRVRESDVAVDPLTPKQTERLQLRLLLKRLEGVSGSAASEIRMAANVLSEMEDEEEADMSRELADELSSTVSDTIAAVNRLLDEEE